MSSKQSTLIVELAEALQWLPSAARVLAWCRLLNSTEALLDNNLVEPLMALLPYVKDVSGASFTKYHDLFATLVQRVPKEYHKKIHKALESNRSILPAPLQAILSASRSAFLC